MRRRLAVVLALALPAGAQAETAMQQDLCREGWRSVNVAMGQAARFRSIEPFVNAEGWCQIDRSVADLREDDFSNLVWHATGVADAIRKSGFPETFESRFSGIDPVEAFNMELPRERVGSMAALHVKAERDPETLDFAIEALDFDFGDLGAAQIRLAGGGIDLSGLKRMQITLGGLRVRDAALSLTTTSDLSRALNAGLSEDGQLALIREAVRLLPDSSVSPESQAALDAFLNAGPGQAGTLELSATSEAGLGMVQIAGGGLQLQQSVSDAELTAAFAHILTGVRIEARWTPES
jgi:hypothetical protein